MLSTEGNLQKGLLIMPLPDEINKGVESRLSECWQGFGLQDKAQNMVYSKEMNQYFNFFMMNTKRNQFLIAMKRIPINCLMIILLIVAGCSDPAETTEELLGEWYKQSSYEGVARSGAVGFVIDGKAYVGTGYDGDKWLKDFYQYDAEKNNWYKKADFPGAARSAAVAFALNGKGYVGTGFDGTNYLKDFYQYDPSTDSWTQIADFSGTARFQATAFVLENYGFVGTGYDGNYLKDIYAYDP